MLMIKKNTQVLSFINNKKLNRLEDVSTLDLIIVTE